MELVSIATAITLTEWSERTFWRRFADGSLKKRETANGKSMVDFWSIKPHICILLDEEDILLIKDADAGEVEAQNDLALIFLSNDKPKSAIYWLKLAAQQDYANAMHLLGRCYIDGNGLARNENLGIMWIAKAASLGDVISQAQMQSMVDRLAGKH